MLRRAIVKLYIQKGNVCCIYELFRMPNVYHLSRSSQIPNGAINYVELNSFNCHNHPATQCMFTLIVQGGSQIITHDTDGMLNCRFSSYIVTSLIGWSLKHPKKILTSGLCHGDFYRTHPSFFSYRNWLKLWLPGSKGPKLSNWWHHVCCHLSLTDEYWMLRYAGH